MIDLDDMDMTTMVGGFLGVVAVLGASILYLHRKEQQGEKDHSDDVDVVMEEITETVSDKPQNKKNKHQRKNDQWKTKSKDAAYPHPWYVTTLKGHSNNVTDIDFASDGKKFVSISDDRSVILWDVRDFEDKEHKCVRQIIEIDTPTRVVFAPDCKSVVFSVKRDNKICVFKLQKRASGAGSHHFVHVENIDFGKSHKIDIAHIGIAGNAKYLMSASADTKVALYDLRGSVLKLLDSKISSLNDCRLSPDGKFVVVSGFTPDVFVFEPTFSREGLFQDAKKVFILSGHNSGVLATAFNATATRAVTVSRDGFWRVFDTDIRYNAGQDAKILRQGKWQPLQGASSDNVRLAVSPSGDSFAVSHLCDLKVFSAEDENEDFGELLDLHSAAITSIRYSSDGKYIASCGDKYVRVIRNVPEWHSKVVKLGKELPETTQEGARRRIKEQIEEAQESLEKYNA